MARIADPQKRSQIIAAATAVFARKGYSRCRIIEVAEAAGIGKGTIYEYFRSKEDLFFAVFEQLMQETGAQMTTAMKAMQGPAADRLAAVADTVIRAWLPRLDLYSLVMEFWSAATVSPSRQHFKEAFRQAYQHFGQVLTTLIQEGQTAGEFSTEVDARKIAAALVGTWDALLLQAWLNPVFNPLNTSEAFMEVLLRGMRQADVKESS